MHKPKLHYAWVIVGAGVIGVMASLGLGRFSYAVILPAMKDALELNYGQMGLLGTGNLAGYLCFSLFGGFLASRYGTKIVIVLSLVFMTITLMLTGMAGGFYGTLAARIFTGVGSAGANVPIMGLASAWFSTRRRGLAAGILVSGSGLGVLATGIFLPEVIKAYGADGWRWAWYYLAALSLVITLICQLLLKDTPAEKNLSPCGTEAAVFTTAPAREQGNKTTTIPLDWGKVYKNPALWQLGLVYFAFGFSYIVYATFFPAHVIKAGNLSQAEAGRIWSLVGFVSMASGFIGGGISDLIGRRAALCIVFCLHTLSFATFAYSTSVIGFYVSALAFGISAWSIPSIVAAFSGDIVGARLAPAAVGAVTVVFSIGQALAPYVAGRLADASGTFFSSFVLAALVALGGAVGALFLNKSEKAV
ncbi:MAG: YbfB/YjiJ family MFS transporter [Deltaproteobacteria bacterium]|nr:YbfB/YjiJ family MFS transporter [Deltaproteobacteria bacterium]